MVAFQKTLILVIDIVFLLVAIEPVAAAQVPSYFRLSGKVIRGQKFSAPMARGYTFRLLPWESGWELGVYAEGAEQDNLAGRTEPLHGINHIQIEGWHFRNSDNSGPNDIGSKNVNAPGERRAFQFCLTAKDLNQFYDEARRGSDINTDCPGRGTLIISELNLGNLLIGEKAWIESMSFEVEGTIGRDSVHNQNSAAVR